MTRAIGDSSWSPDDKQIAFVTNISGRNNIWLVSSQSGWPTQLTVSNQRQANVAWSPKGRWIAYNSDYDGNEQWDLFLVSASNGQVVNLTNSPEVSEEGAAWSPDGEKLAYSVKPKQSPNYEIDIIEIQTKKVTHLTSNTPAQLSNFNPIWSRDGKWIVFTQQNAAGKDANIFIANSAGGRATNLTPHEGERNFLATDISPDGKTVLITSNAGNGYQNVGLLDVATKKITWLTEDKWEVTSGKFSPDGKRLTWTANVDGNQDIYLYYMATRRALALPVAKGINSLAGAETAFSHDGTRLLYTHNGPDAPNDVWAYDFTAQKRTRSPTLWLVACAAKTWSNLFWSTIPAKTANGRFRHSSTCRTTRRRTARTRRSCTFTAARRHRPSIPSTAAFSTWSTRAFS